MKKLINAVAILAASASLFAVSYKNNTYQKLADEYNKKAHVAFDAGQYDDAVEKSCRKRRAFPRIHRHDDGPLQCRPADEACTEPHELGRQCPCR